MAIEAKYQPLSSVWHGEDAELQEHCLSFYPRKRPKLILDATVNGGRFWRDSKRPVIGLDLEPKYRPAVVADNMMMPFQESAFDAIVYDPRHIPNQGKDRSKDFNSRFGLGLRVPKEQGYNSTHTFPPFLREAWRVLKLEGILPCKITDYIHHHRYQWAHIELIQAAQMAGFRACDCIVKGAQGTNRRSEMEDRPSHPTACREPIRALAALRKRCDPPRQFARRDERGVES